MLKGYRIYTYVTKSVAFPANTVKDSSDQLDPEISILCLSQFLAPY